MVRPRKRRSASRRRHSETGADAHPFGTHASRVAAFLLLVAIAPPLGCWREGAVEPVEPVNVVLITIDTLRQDHLSRNGHSRETTPTLDRLAEEGVYWQQSYAQSSWTLPSMLSLFSSLPPAVFGIREGLAPLPKPGEDGRDAPDRSTFLREMFAEQNIVLPEVLQEAGWVTAGFSTNGHLCREQGFAQGFDYFDQTSCMWGDAACVTGAATGWLDEPRSTDEERPLFLWVHFFDPHFDRAGWPPVYEAPAGYEDRFRANADTVEEETRIAYDRKIRYMDDRLAEFLEDLGARGLLGNTLLVVAADHGEEFAEKKRWGHSRSVRNTLVHVPLLMKFPGGEFTGDRGETVSNQDIAPTVLEYLGLAIPDEMEGESLLPVLRGGSPPESPVYGETRRFGRDLRFLLDRASREKLVLNFRDQRARLYDLDSDPDERHNLSRVDRERTQELVAMLEDAVEGMEARSTRSAVADELTDEQVQRLRTLGYLH
jgi:arylsulfatase A-like enzyme